MDELGACGANDCPWYNMTAIAQRPSDNTIWTMLSIYIGVASFSVIIVSCLVDSLPKHFIDSTSVADSTKGEVASSLLATLKQLRHLNQLLLIPLTMYTGFEQAAFSAEWSRSFVTCGFGMWKVGLVTLPFGCLNAFTSLTFSHLVKFVGRTPVFFAGFIVDAGIQLTLVFWRPAADEEYVLYILSGLWGMSDGIWETQINALYGCLFVDETPAAFANFRLWQSVGFVIPFAYSNFLCTDVKLYILMLMLLLGMTGYVVVEARHRSSLKQRHPPHFTEMMSLSTNPSHIQRNGDEFL